MTTRAPKTIGLMSPGDMGHAVGAVLHEGGLRVITNLEGRSERTRGLAGTAKIEDVGSDEVLVAQADVLLSILVPSEAERVAARIAAAVSRVGTTLLYVDCNAIAPQTVRRIAEHVTQSGAGFIDAGIIGGPPRVGGDGPRFYASGEDAATFAELAHHGLDVRVMGSEIGAASGLKMCYAAFTKGTTALATELLVAARAMGISETLEAELRSGGSDRYASLERSVPGMPPKAYRWVGEMEEIAATFGALGLTRKILEGAAELYRFVERTPLGQETPERRTRGTTLDEVVEILAEALSDAGARR
jgi:3-hydroxyisobutyrate dehydrogenase-like beta-hydroxyacid dehydrogenase